MKNIEPPERDPAVAPTESRHGQLLVVLTVLPRRCDQVRLPIVLYLSPSLFSLYKIKELFTLKYMFNTRQLIELHTYLISLIKYMFI